MRCMKWKDCGGSNRSILYAQKVLSTVSISSTIGSARRPALQDSSKTPFAIGYEDRDTKMIYDKATKRQSKTRPQRLKNQSIGMNPCNNPR